MVGVAGRRIIDLTVSQIPADSGRLIEGVVDRHPGEGAWDGWRLVGVGR